MPEWSWNQGFEIGAAAGFAEFFDQALGAAFGLRRREAASFEVVVALVKDLPEAGQEAAGPGRETRRRCLTAAARKV